MLTEQAKYDGILTAIRAFVPDFNTELKVNSKTQKLIGNFLGWLGNKLYMECYWTTIGKTVYRPTACGVSALEDEWQIMLHEGRHVDDCYKLGIVLDTFLYLFPQIIGMLGVLYALVVIPVVALGGPMALLWGLLSLLCLAPIPSLPRALMEARAYTVSLAVSFWCGLIKDEEGYINDLADRFVDTSYYFMWPFKSLVRNYFRGILKDLKEGVLDLDPYLVMCRSKCFSYR